MKFPVSTSSLNSLDTACLIVFLSRQNDKAVLSPFGQSVDAAVNGQLSRLLDRDLLKAKREHIDFLLDVEGLKTDSIMLVGMGDADELDIPKTRKLFGSVVSNLSKRDIENAVVSLVDFCSATDRDDVSDQAVFAQCLIESAYASQYRYTETKGKAQKKSDDKTDHSLEIALWVDDARHQGTIERHVAIGQAVGAGTNLTKNLSNLPGNVCTPTYLANAAQKVGKAHSMNTTVLDEAKMKKLGMGALLSVSKGSREPAKLITLEYEGGSKKQAPIVLVGKGLTFDAGGISLKPAATMDEMKYDMCGGATVLGVMQAVGELKLPINVTGVIASSENLPDGAANKPGDVVTSMKGLTIEILNTDAEGRLILCDALTYVERFKPAAVIDIATLTGACMVALGQQASGLFSNDDDLADALLEAGETAGDRAWRMPVWDEYQPQLKSNFADLANIGGRFAGAVTAACFLKRFAEEYKWAHLDIAGTAWKSGANKGATGRPVGLLMQYLLDTLKP